MSYPWLGKYVAQKLYSSSPFGAEFNAFFQKTMGALRRPVIHGYPRTLTMLWLLEQCGVSLKGQKSVELGTGWDLSSAMTLSRAGADEVVTYDHLRHVNPELQRKASDLLESSFVLVSRV